MDNSNLQNLPIFKHFDSDQIGKSTDNFRKGEKGLYSIIKLLILCAVGYFSWIYVLPPVFKALGQISAIAISIIAVVALVIAAPVILKGIRRLTRALHKSVIRHDPFAELESQEVKLVQNKERFQVARGKIAKLKRDMETSADESQKRAETYQKKILTLSDRAKKLQSTLTDLEKKLGNDAKGDDKYVNAHIELNKVLSEARRLEHQLNQEKEFIRKYGVRGAIMKKFSQKLRMVDGAMDIKISDFRATVEMLKKDYAFAKESKNATTTAKDAMQFTEGWEVEYALDVVTTTIASDIAITTSNLTDIDKLTATGAYSLDSDELFANLDSLSGRIRTGKDIIPQAKSYDRADYQLSREDRLASNGFDELF